MQDDPQWPGQQPGDLATFTFVSRLIEDDSEQQLYLAIGLSSPKALVLERFGRWAAIVSEINDAHLAGGQPGALRRYLHVVYRDPAFAVLMASLGMESPTREWQQGVRPRGKLPKSLPLANLLTGRYKSRAPAGRHALREEEVFAALCELGEATVADLARHTGQDRGNVHRRVQRLLERGRIERYTTPRAIVYRVRV